MYERNCTFSDKTDHGCTSESMPSNMDSMQATRASSTCMPPVLTRHICLQALLQCALALDIHTQLVKLLLTLRPALACRGYIHTDDSYHSINNPICTAATVVRKNEEEMHNCT